MAPRWIVELLALLAVFFSALRPPLNYGFMPVLLVALALVPVWWPAMRGYVGGTLAVVGSAVTIVAGLLLTWVTTVYGHHSFDTPYALTLISRLLGFGCTVGVLLWARSVLRLGTVAVAYGFGMLVFAIPNIAGSPNPWKFVLSVPITIIVLGLLHNRSGVGSIVALFALAGIGALNDSRSYAGIAAFTALLLVLAALRRRSGQVWNRAAMVVVVVSGVAVLYNLGTSLLVGGALGDQIAERTTEQIDNSGNLIVGGRPEWMATLNLAPMHPFGLGIGAQADLADYRATRDGLISAGITTYEGYVDNYMLAAGIKLHSIVAELWIHFGLVGLAYGISIIALFAYALLTTVARTGFTALIGYLSINCTWFMLFGPLYSDFPVVAFALAMVLVSKHKLAQTRAQHDAQPGEPVGVSAA